MKYPRIKPTTALLFAGVATLAGVVIVRADQSPAVSTASATASASAADGHDAEQWRHTAAACFDANDFACAVDGYQKAVAIAPNDGTLWSALGEARVMASQHDPMPAAALDAFHRAVALAPKDPRARYFLAVARDLSGDHRGAITDWLAILAETPPGAPWEKDLRRTIEQVGKLHDIPVADQLAAVRQPAAPAAAQSPAQSAPMPGVPGPSPEDLAAATAIPPSQQRAMAEAMVDKLDQRLTAEPHNADGWIMLMRSRINLDQRDQAQAALRRALKADPGDAAAIRAGAEQLGMQ